MSLDPTELRVFALACQGELKAAQTGRVQLKALEIEKLKFQIAKLRRMQFGRSSERISRQIVRQIGRGERHAIIYRNPVVPTASTWREA
jgi:Transposase C of IS166 homeodomain